MSEKKALPDLTMKITLGVLLAAIIIGIPILLIIALKNRKSAAQQPEPVREVPEKAGFFSTLGKLADMLV